MMLDYIGLIHYSESGSLQSFFFPIWTSGAKSDCKDLNKLNIDKGRFNLM